MSTGLTYVNLLDTGISDNPVVGGSYVFNSYEEARAYGDWYCRSIINGYSGVKEVYVYIYTTSPNSSGYISAAVDPPVFTVFD
jgi:hypothetical protein